MIFTQLELYSEQILFDVMSDYFLRRKRQFPYLQNQYLKLPGGEGAGLGLGGRLIKSETIFNQISHSLWI